MKEADAKATVEIVDRIPDIQGKPTKKSGGGSKKKKPTRAKARSGSEKLTPAALYRKMITFGKAYQVEKEQDFIEAARIYAEEAGLIDQMRDRIAEDARPRARHDEETGPRRAKKLLKNAAFFDGLLRRIHG